MSLTFKKCLFGLTSGVFALGAGECLPENYWADQAGSFWATVVAIPADLLVAYFEAWAQGGA